MIRRLLAGYVSITVFLVAALGVPLGVLYARHERATLVSEVRLEATEVATFAVIPLARDQPAILDEVADRYGRTTGGRIVVTDARGVSVADSEDATGRPFTSRPEVGAALDGHESHGFRHSDTVGSDLFYVAVPVNSGAVVLGAVRVTYPASFVASRIHRSWAVLAAVGLGALAAVLTVSVAAARWIARPVQALGRAAARLGAGDLAARAEVPHRPPEVHSLAQSFNEMAADLERLVTAQQAFVADASHQLRTPLAALRLRLENLEASVPAAERDDVAGALAEVLRLARLVDGLLLLARADATPAMPQPVDVDAVVAQRAANWGVFAAEHDVAIAVEGRAGRAALTPDSLEQILDNLIANAIEASPAGTTIRLVATGERDGAPACVRVIDEGPGMTEEQRAAAFTRFLSTSGTGRSGRAGFGLGLAIAQRLIRKDGGDLGLRDAAGGGLAAVVQLPRRD